MKGYRKECAVDIANYIIEHDATVRQTAKAFGVKEHGTYGSNITERFAKRVI